MRYSAAWYIRREEEDQAPLCTHKLQHSTPLHPRMGDGLAQPAGGSFTPSSRHGFAGGPRNGSVGIG